MLTINFDLRTNLTIAKPATTVVLFNAVENHDLINKFNSINVT